jgi:hypothetical protein
MKILRSWVAAAAAVTMAGAAQAALVDLGDGTVKDTNTNLIWLQNWNFNGERARWDAQNNWANDLTFAGSSDWAIPELSEYESLFGAYGDLTQVTAFTNVMSMYWSSTADVPGQILRTFHPAFGFGGIGIPSFDDSIYWAVAVRPGDVAAAVPEPQTLALALLALGATVVARRRRPA